MKRQPKSEDPNLIDANQTAKILNVSRGQIERFQILGQLTPQSTIFSLYYFSKNQVLELKKTLK